MSMISNTASENRIPMQSELKEFLFGAKIQNKTENESLKLDLKLFEWAFKRLQRVVVNDLDL